MATKTVKRHKYAAGATLVEVMVAMVVLAIAALGALGYQYHAAKHAKVAHAQMAATRTAQLLLEDWKSTGGSTDYNPAALGLGFSSVTIPYYFTMGKGKGKAVGAPLHNEAFGITVDDVAMMVVLRWKDIAHDGIAEVTLRQLSVALKWAESPHIPPIILTTYVRLDAAGG